MRSTVMGIKTCCKLYEKNLEGQANINNSFPGRPLTLYVRRLNQIHNTSNGVKINSQQNERLSKVMVLGRIASHKIKEKNYLENTTLFEMGEQTCIIYD